MKNNKWKYYNHAAIPTCAPHELADITPILDGSIWKKNFFGSRLAKTPLFAIYTETFNQECETLYWYIIKESPFLFDELDKKYKKHVNKAFERTYVKLIDKTEYIEELYEVYEAAYRNYRAADNELSKENFIEGVLRDEREYWAAFSKETDEMAGWMSCENHGDWTETASAKYHPERQSYNRPSDVLHYAVLSHYLNELGQKYVCSGSRNINHVTNVQDYKEKNWKFKRAYCKLRVVYNPKIGWLVKCMYPFRKFLLKLDTFSIIHQLNGVLRLEECNRT